MRLFLRERGSTLSGIFFNGLFVDIFALLNRPIQGHTVIILESSERLQTFQMRLELWTIRIAKKHFAISSNLHGISYPGCFVSSDLSDISAALKWSFGIYFSIRMISMGIFTTILSEVKMTILYTIT